MSVWRFRTSKYTFTIFATRLATYYDVMFEHPPTTFHNCIGEVLTFDSLMFPGRENPLTHYWCQTWVKRQCDYIGSTSRHTIYIYLLFSTFFYRSSIYGEGCALCLVFCHCINVVFDPDFASRDELCSHEANQFCCSTPQSPPAASIQKSAKHLATPKGRCVFVRQCIQCIHCFTHLISRVLINVYLLQLNGSGSFCVCMFAAGDKNCSQVIPLKFTKGWTILEVWRILTADENNVAQSSLKKSHNCQMVSPWVPAPPVPPSLPSTNISPPCHFRPLTDAYLKLLETMQ